MNAFPLDSLNQLSRIIASHSNEIFSCSAILTIHYLFELFVLCKAIYITKKYSHSFVFCLWLLPFCQFYDILLTIVFAKLFVIFKFFLCCIQIYAFSFLQSLPFIYGLRFSITFIILSTFTFEFDDIHLKLPIWHKQNYNFKSQMLGITSGWWGIISNDVNINVMYCLFNINATSFYLVQVQGKDCNCKRHNLFHSTQELQKQIKSLQASWCTFSSTQINLHMNFFLPLMVCKSMQSKSKLQQFHSCSHK